MNINRKTVKVNLQGKEYDMIMDFAAAIEFQDLFGISIYKAIDMILKELDIKALAYMIATCVKDENNQSIGLEKVKELGVLENVYFFVQKISELVDNSLPKAQKELIANQNKKK